MSSSVKDMSRLSQSAYSRIGLVRWRKRGASYGFHGNIILFFFMFYTKMSPEGEVSYVTVEVFEQNKRIGFIDCGKTESATE